MVVINISFGGGGRWNARRRDMYLIRSIQCRNEFDIFENQFMIESCATRNSNMLTKFVSDYRMEELQNKGNRFLFVMQSKKVREISRNKASEEPRKVHAVIRRTLPNRQSTKF